MVFDQRILLKDNNGLFEHCWQAATSSKIKLNAEKSVVDQVDISATCEKLYKVMSESLISTQQNHVPFRFICKLWYGSVRIFQYQVNSLTGSCLQLLSHIGIIEKCPLDRKRKYAVKKLCTAKKRCFTLSETTVSDLQKTSQYTQLYEESQDIVRWAQSSEIFSMVETISASVVQNSAYRQSNTVKCFKVREISFREINTDVHTLFGEDDFGFATKADFQELQKFCNELNLVQELEAPSNNSEEFVGHNENNKPFGGNPTSTIIQFNKQDSTLTNQLFDTNGDEEINNNLKPVTSHNKTAVLQCQSGKQIRKSKLLVDKIKHFSSKQIRKNIIRTKREDRRKIMTGSVKKLKKLKETFNLSNFHSTILSYDIHPPRSLLKNSVCKDYQNIVRAILSNQYSELLAEEVCPVMLKPTTNTVVSRKRKHYDELNGVNFDHVHDSEQIMTDFEIAHTDIVKQVKKDKFSDWSPFNLIMKLLDIWRISNEDEIDVKKLVLSTNNRIIGALIIHSLLTLAAQKLIILVKSENTIDISKIKLGTVSSELIHGIQRSNCLNANLSHIEKL